MPGCPELKKDLQEALYCGRMVASLAGGISAVGSAPHSHCGGRRFESDMLQTAQGSAGKLILSGASAVLSEKHPTHEKYGILSGKSQTGRKGMEQHHFVNRYRYDKATAKEAMGAYWKWKNRKAFVALGVMVAFFCVLSPVFETVLFLIPALIGVIGFISLYVQMTQSIAVERKNIANTFRTDAPWLKIEIDDEWIHTTVSNTKKKVPVTDIIRCQETKNMFVLFLKGQMTLALRRDSFEAGTPEAFKAFADLLTADRKK